MSLIFIHVGKHCQVNINECASSPCQNKGICLDKINSYQCRCQTGYNGTNCENKIDWCAVNQCSENSNCSSGLSTYTCDCFQGRQVLTLVTCFHFWLRTTQIKYWFSRLKSFWQMAKLEIDTFVFISSLCKYITLPFLKWRWRQNDANMSPPHSKQLRRK